MLLSSKLRSRLWGAQKYKLTMLKSR
uniref:Uncharacterized protein n=1 Tax=Lepeophtheirus salmonis TaxID=72036 RepID=A0A0K2TWU0_LEPSM